MERERQERLAANETVFREINERIQDGHQKFDVTGPAEFLCECSNAGCAERIHLSVDEYETLRADPKRFAIVLGHDVEGVERVVDANERFAVVEKIEAAARVAEERDPRAFTPSWQKLDQEETR